MSDSAGGYDPYQPRGWIDNEGPTLEEDSDDKPRRSIWDDDGETTGDGYSYKPPSSVPTDRPQGFWGAGGGGNPWWGAPTSGQRWGDDPTGGMDPTTGQPKAPRGSVSYGGTAKIGRDTQRKVGDILGKYDKVRHPGRRLKGKIKADLSSRLPRSEVRKVMKDQNWL